MCKYGEFMEYEVKTKEFEGPLDLLLHLVKKENINIFDINIEEIIKQYLDYISKMKDESLDVTSEYLVMASELIELKSKMLLPNKSEEIDEEIEEATNNLINRLLVYDKYKNMKDEFRNLEDIRGKLYTRESEEILSFKHDDDIDYGIDLDDLVKAFNKFLEYKEMSKPLNTKIETKELSVNERCIDIRKKIKINKTLNFKDLFDKVSKEYVVVTFLALLSMARNHELIIKQDNNFTDITIEARK